MYNTLTIDHSALISQVSQNTSTYKKYSMVTIAPDRYINVQINVRDVFRSSEGK